MPGQAACARRPVTSRMRGRSGSAEPSGLTGGARMTRCTGTRRTEPCCGSTGSVAAGADTPSAVPTNWVRIRARLRRASRAVVYRTANRRTCAAAGGRRGSPGRQGGASAPGGRKRQRSLPAGPRPLGGSGRRRRLERVPPEAAAPQTAPRPGGNQKGSACPTPTALVELPDAQAAATTSVRDGSLSGGGSFRPSVASGVRDGMTRFVLADGRTGRAQARPAGAPRQGMAVTATRLGARTGLDSGTRTRYFCRRTMDGAAA